MQRFFILIALVIALLAVPVLAQDDTVRIDFPPPVYDVAGVVEIRGTVNPPNLQSYFLETAPYGLSEDEARWTPATLPSRNSVTGGVIGQWNTTLLADGLYQLRLRVLLSTGETRTAIVSPIRVANQLSASGGGTTVVQAATPIPLAPVVPTPTEAPPPTPTVPPRPQVVNQMPIPLGGHISNFNEGALDHMRTAGMTWIKWQIPYVIGQEDNLLVVARDRIHWSHANGFLAFLSIKGEKEALGEMDEEYFPLYADFVGRVAELGPDAIQIWNEMNLDREWPQGKIDPRMYVELLRQSYEAIKAADPQVKVITGAPAPTGAEGAFGLDRVWNDDRYYLGMANAGAANYADCIGIHYNEGIIPPSSQGGDPRGTYPTYYFPLMLQRAAFPFRNTPTRFCFSEMGYLTPEGYGELPGGFAWAANTSVEEQATWIRDAVQIAAQTSSVPVDLIIIWNVDFSNFDEDPMAGYAIIRPDGSCPACEALSTLKTQ